MRLLVGWLFILLCVAWLGWKGLVLRDAIWDQTPELRFNGDIDNGFHWGKRANAVGYFNLYDEFGTPAPGSDTVDYGPLRLGVMTAWVNWLTPRYPHLWRRDPSRAFHAPLLWFNTGIEIATALSAWLLTTQMIRRQPVVGLIDERRWLPRGVGLGFVAAMMVWWNPIILLNAHAWPQWDIWPMPFFLLSVYLGCRRRWMLGGFLVGVASLLKGQIFMVAWTLPVWALCMGDWRGALRFVFGALCAVALGGCVWELSIYLPGEHGYRRAVAAGEPIRRINWPATIWVACWTLFALLLPRRFSISAICVAMGVSLFSTMWLFGGSQHWLECGYLTGTWHYPAMAMGPTSNLPAMLQDDYGYDDIKYVCFTVDMPVRLQAWFGPQLEVTMKALLLSNYFTVCLFCAVFAAVNDRRRDPRLIIAICLPWLLFFTLPPQIHERYLLFFSTCAAAFVSCGLGYTLLGVAVSFVGLCTTVHQILLCAGIQRGNGNAAEWQLYPTLHAFAAGTHPGIAWLLLLAAAVFLYSIVPASPGQPLPRRGTSLDA